MKWKRRPYEFLSQKTFLIIKDDDLRMLKDATKTTESEKTAVAKNVANTGTWPPKMKRVQAFCGEEEPERPKTANLTKPSVLDPKLVDKLDMSLLSKELLCDSMTRLHQSPKPASGGTTTLSSSSSLLPSPSSATRRRQTTARSFQDDVVPVRRKRRNFEQISEPSIPANQMEIDRSPDRSTGSRKSTSLMSVTTQEHTSINRNSDVRKLDDNNNRNAPPKVLSTVKKKNSRVGLPSDLEIFTTTSTPKSAPEPCKSCGRPDQPERFHSHPKGSQKIKDIHPSPAMTKPKPTTPSVPKSIQKPVALNFRSDRNKNKLQEIETKSNASSQDPSQNSDQPMRPSSTPMKRGPRAVTCYICGREFGTASFPIHEPKCMEKWERENNLLPPSQRRPRPQRPVVGIEHNDWNAAAWEQSQVNSSLSGTINSVCEVREDVFAGTIADSREKLQSRSKNSRFTTTIVVFYSFFPLLYIFFSNNEMKQERLATPLVGARNMPPTVPCRVCGRNFGTRSIKIHEPQCNRRRQMQNDSANAQKDKSASYRQNSANDQENSSSTYPNLSQKKTVTCYICGRDFGTSSIAIHEPQCLKKWHAENDKLSPARRRQEPQKPDVIYIQDPQTGNQVVDQAATAEANWMTHLSQLVPCKHCGRTFNPDRVNIHEKSVNLSNLHIFSLINGLCIC